ncbi:glucocorticoid modulatory element-binding protein 1 isoform X1 [Hippoglossus hippoglossus]|uniref:glucocorticoid modulatory element-binding protein 1 isoform X1 n=1 Tax=Hippoglossus hippoglossus TaxID=8267 RepID=UPI00148DD7E5|nr:glucocorticoid modulatory element-binding protein 1 isoform X1 [Hippoglossus hippoglossus]XP_034455594.1 glucocorticoid modulatory element-binding protein 1 isoform X1 [Hippoglossus hippoglossus]XP_034455595.1 glucocorticoid modulatory element-binding protein 1 isoform X1 [Hippoglossus hippoglossus]XP_035038901.1 glucocorticoid modulatory element-binding protein 1 isoform X1 [Hippoglossus stenolepis]XP_035038902.1 glucocorticoid modulatory element-binding protein 1 isoform X1 [Hippoglossus s
MMATTEEVAVSMGEVVMLKADEEGDPDDPNKTQVILQLQPIPTGDESAETDAAVMAVEAPPEQTDGDDVEIGCAITCGDCKAMLLLKKFVCPGINVKCVKYEDQLISPKQFVHISGKATLKDWKRAIRMGGVMLRKMMDSGQLDFYQHSTLCTNTCRSTKFDLLINNTRFPPDGTGLGMPTSSQAQVVLGNGGTVGEDRPEALCGKLDWSSLESVDKKESNEISEDTLNFWKGIADVGLLGEVVTNISTELLEMLNGVQQLRDLVALQDTDSCLVEVAVLSNLAQVFGLLDSVKKILERRRQQTDPIQDQVLSTLSNLEVQLEEQRKQQQVRALLSCPQPAKNKTPTKRQTKRPRLQRPASTTTLLASPINQQATLQPQQFTVLSPLSLSSMGQPFTMAGLPIATLAQSSKTVTLLPAGSQFFTRYMVTGDGKGDTITLHPSSGLTLVGTTSMQDSCQLGTMMSPVELVHLTQQSGSTEVVPIEGQMIDGTMLVQQEMMQGEVDTGQEHTVIEINPAPVEQAVGVMELQLTGEQGRDEASMVVPSGMEVTVAGEGVGTQCQIQQGQTEGIQGLQLDASGQLSNVQIVVIGGNTQVENQVK